MNEGAAAAQQPWWGRPAAWLPRTGHVLSVEAFFRPRGGQQSGRRRRRFWAFSVPNWTLGQKYNLLKSACSPTLIKSAKPLE